VAETQPLQILETEMLADPELVEVTDQEPVQI
jgi:hypothetical protein